VVLLPQNWDERRDRALALIELGRAHAAIADQAYPPTGPMPTTRWRRPSGSTNRAARRACIELPRSNDLQRPATPPHAASGLALRRAPGPVSRWTAR
jgi:hypothetical protein